MQITNCGRGIHKREVKGIDRFRSSLPNNWYAFTNLDLALGTGRAREVDLIIVAERRIFVVDIKDWHGRIESADGRWFLNGEDKDASPVAKINDIARNIYILLKAAMAKRPESKTLAVPKIEGLVVLTGKADRSGIAETEAAKVLTVNEFLASIATAKAERSAYGNVAEQFLAEPLTEPVWKDRLTRFLNAGPNSPFRPGRRKFQRYVAQESASYEHPAHIYREYEAQEDGTPPSLGTLRLWDFSKVADTRFQTEEGRREIAGRERQVYHWLRDRSEDVERSLLTPRIDDPELGIQYWEIYDRRRRLKRLSDFASTETGQLSPNELVELARQVISAVAELHRHSASHLDLGMHSIWLEAPTTVRLSHLFAARFPDVKSLGPSRYHFLASVRVPEDVLGNDAGPERRDVFLTGVAVHQLLFGKIPASDPPEWDPTADAEARFARLHDWFSEALDIEPNKRFPDARAALEAYNKATAEHPTPEEVVAGLDRFRGAIRSQLTLLSAYPMANPPIKESDSVDAWRSLHEGAPVVVKMWKQGAWGDLRKEGARVLAFLERAREIKADAPIGVPGVRAVLWLGDAFALVQDWVEGFPLSVLIENPPEAWRSPEGALGAVLSIVDAIERTHDAGLGHGDLKPDNIVVGDGGSVFLIDILDFTPLSDGEIQNSAYSPGGGDRLARDRFAATKIAEQVFGLCDLAPEHAVKLASAIADCRTKEPRLASLLPLQEAIEAVRNELQRPAPRATHHTLALSVTGAALGPIEADEGFYYLRAYAASVRGPATLHLRGATEEIEIRLDERGHPTSARRRRLPQTQISIVARHEFHRFAGGISVSRSDHTDLHDLDDLLSDAAVASKMAEVIEGRTASAVADESRESVPEDEAAQEQLVEEISKQDGAESAADLDVPLMWRALIDIEKDLTTEGVAVADSVFDAAIGRHRIGFDLESGAFDFSRNDTVGVQRQDRKGGWRRIGELDIKSSHANAIVIDPTDYGAPGRFRLVEVGQRLRFISHFETESLRRRTDAVERILKGNGRASNLLSVFDPRAHARPSGTGHMVDLGDLKPYELNTDQISAFTKLIVARPVGLLQGPPGTGKTRFIAALAHYAITKKLARNVLLSSQSHEAVNTAGEALLKLFRKTGGEPSVLRVAMNDDQVSDLIRPFHTGRVEQAFKDRFEASFRERIGVAGTALGLADDVVEDIVTTETAIRPVAAKITELLNENEPDLQRINGLKASLAAHLTVLQLGDKLADDVGTDAESFVQTVLGCLSERSGRVRIGSDKIARLRAVIRLGRDFIGSASRPQRSFETFLAGTRQIVLGTCVGLGRASLGLTANAFDLVIVDEAARCTASELLVPLQAARWAVLVGDQAQLEPNHDAEVINGVADRTKIPKKEILRSDFERVFLTGYGSEAGARLHIQYRMLPPIGKLISEVFYPSLTLEPGRMEPEIDAAVLPADLSHPLTWIETDGLGEAAYDRKIPESGSRTNRVEADAIVAMLTAWHGDDRFRDWMMTQTSAPIAIGIICMYAAQRDLIHHLLLRSALGHLLGKQLKVGTVDSYQGKENPVVLLSLVRNNADGLRDPVVKTIQEGFLASSNRINVAASRAMDRLVIVGARKRWATSSPMGRLAAGFERREKEGEARGLAVETILGSGRPKDVSAKHRSTKPSPSRATVDG